VNFYALFTELLRGMNKLPQKEPTEPPTLTSKR